MVSQSSLLNTTSLSLTIGRAAAAVYLHNKNDQDDINLQIDGYKHFFSVAHDHPKSSGVQVSGYPAK